MNEARGSYVRRHRDVSEPAPEPLAAVAVAAEAVDCEHERASAATAAASKVGCTVSTAEWRGRAAHNSRMWQPTIYCRFVWPNDRAEWCNWCLQPCNEGTKRAHRCRRSLAGTLPAAPRGAISQREGRFFELRGRSTPLPTQPPPAEPLSLAQTRQPVNCCRFTWPAECAEWCNWCRKPSNKGTLRTSGCRRARDGSLHGTRDGSLPGVAEESCEGGEAVRGAATAESREGGDGSTSGDASMAAAVDVLLTTDGGGGGGDGAAAEAVCGTAAAESTREGGCGPP